MYDMDEMKISYNWEAECNRLKEELCHIKRELDECEHLLNEAQKECERLKAACSEQEDELHRYEGQIEVFKFVIEKGR